MQAALAQDQALEARVPPLELSLVPFRGRYRNLIDQPKKGTQKPALLHCRAPGFCALHIFLTIGVLLCRDRLAYLGLKSQVWSCYDQKEF